MEGGKITVSSEPRLARAIRSVRRYRFPAVIASGVIYVVLLPWLGWHWAQSMVLFCVITLFYWLPGIIALIGVFKAGGVERRKSRT